MNNLESVEGICYRYFIKYNRLSELIRYSFSGSQATEIDLYIDLYSLYHRIMSRTGKTDMSDYTALTSSIINMASHYRSFFKRFGVNTTIFFISSYNIPEINLKLVPGYNKDMLEKSMERTSAEMVKVNIELSELICQYLYHVYFFRTNFESTVLMDHLIKTRNVNHPKIIISMDTYPMNLCYRYPETVLIRAKKSGGVDTSVITLPKGYSTAVYEFWYILYRESRLNGPDASTISVSPSNFDLLQALSRFPERNMNSILSVKEASELIFNTIGTLDTKINLDLLLSSNPNIYNSLDISSIQARYNALNLDFQYNLFMDSIEPNLIQYKDLYDPESLSKINDTYFKNNPIDLQRL